MIGVLVGGCAEYTVPMPSSLEKKSGFLRFYWDVLMRVSPYWLGVYVVGNILMAFFHQSVPFLTRRFINALTLNQADQAGRALLFMVAATLLSKAFFRLWAHADRKIAPEGSMKIHMIAMHKLMAKSYGFFTRTPSGQILTKVNGLSGSFQQLLNVAQDGYTFIISGLVALGALLFQGWVPFLVAIGYIVIGILYTVRETERMRPFEEKKTETRVKFVGQQSDVLTQAQTVILFASQSREARHLQKYADRFQTAWIQRAVLFIRANTVIMAGSFVFETVVMVTLYFQWRAGSATVGDIALYQLLVGDVIQKVNGFAKRANEIQDFVVNAEQGMKLLEIPEEVVDVPGAKKLRVTNGEVAFSGVRFGYGRKDGVVHDFSTVIKPGERVALVGRSGAGKSTILKLLLRLYNLEAGEICIDGQPIDRVTQKSLRDAISYVPQEPLLFHRTLRENIVYGNPDVSEKQMIAAAKRAHCHEFISKLPEKYDSLVGERGVKLSGGERQRVAIARAILKDAPILLLDEATSALDPESEQFIQRAMEELMDKKTVMVIAHRLSTIRHADRVLVMDEGSIIDEGSHDELLSRDSLYRDFWERQTHGYRK